MNLLRPSYVLLFVDRAGSRGPTARLRASVLLHTADLDHAPLVRAHPDRAVALGHLDVEAELALVGDLAQDRADRAGAPLDRRRHVLDADLEADGRPPVREVLVGEDRGAALHHPDHPRGGEDAGADRAADVGDEAVLDREVLAALEPGLQGHAAQTIPRPPLTPSVSPVT